MRTCLAALLLALAVSCAPTPPAPAPAAGWELVVLGIAQDGGMPHLGCPKPPCTDVREGRRRPEKVVSLGLVNRALGRAYLFEATPDLPAQIHALVAGLERPRRKPVDGIFLTHGHIGHYTGLMYLGKETLSADAVPVHGTPRMTAFLAANGPWSLLAKDRHVELRPLAPGAVLDLGDGVTVSSFLVPHRDEFTDTVGYRIRGPRRTAIFIPDIDKWEKWDADPRSPGRIEDHVESCDLAFLDCTFMSTDELGHRDASRVPHPLAGESEARLGRWAGRVRFIHLNHSNPLIVDGPAREALELRGFRVAREGERYPL